MPLLQSGGFVDLHWGDDELALSCASHGGEPEHVAIAERMLSALVGAIPTVVDQALPMPDSQRQAFTPMLAILSAQHETQYSRLFRS